MFMSIAEKQKEREGLTRHTVKDFVLSNTGESLGLVSLTETSYQLYSQDTRVMAFAEREGIVRLDTPYAELPSPIQKFVDRLALIGYEIDG